MEDGNRIASKQVVVLFGIRRIGFPTLLRSAANVLFWAFWLRPRVTLPINRLTRIHLSLDDDPSCNTSQLLHHSSRRSIGLKTHLHAPIIVSRSGRPSTPNALSCLWKSLHVTALASPCPQCRGSTCKLDRLASFPQEALRDGLSVDFLQPLGNRAGVHGVNAQLNLPYCSRVRAT